MARAREAAYSADMDQRPVRVTGHLPCIPPRPPTRRPLQWPTGFDPGRTRQKWPDGPAPQASRSSAASRLASAFSAIESAARNQSQPTPATPRYTAQGPAGAPYGAQSRPGFGQRKPGVFGTKQ